jgi:predicted nucleotidyltransferase
VGTVLKDKRAEYSLRLESTLERIINHLSKMPEVEKVILFGSYAAGRRDLFTDLDLIVVMESEAEHLQRTAELYGLLESDVDLDLLVYTPQEFGRMRELGFLSHALETGKVIYEKERA